MFLDKSNPPEQTLTEELSDRLYLVYESSGVDRLTWQEDETRREIHVTDQAGYESDIPSEIGVLSEIMELPPALEEIVRKGLNEKTARCQKHRITGKRIEMAERGILNRLEHGEYELAVDIPYKGLEEVAERYQVTEDRLTSRVCFYFERGELDG